MKSTRVISDFPMCKATCAMRQQHAGFTLVELMVALVLGLIVVGGVISVLLSNQQSYRTNQALSQLQDNSRTAFELLARDIRQAGSTPCGNTEVTSILNGTAGTVWYQWVDGAGIQGVDNATTLVPALAAAAAQPAIVTRGVGLVSPTMITPAQPCGAGIPLPNAPAEIAANDLVMACDGEQAYIFQTQAFGGGLLRPVAAGTPGNNLSLATCGSFANTAYVAPYNADAWYVAPAGVGAPAGMLSLYRAHYLGGALRSDEIIRGVIGLQISYLVNGGAGFVNAAAVAGDWAKVSAVQVALTLRSVTNPNNAAQPEPLVRTFTTTINVR